jgi:hypothetical protein
MNDNDDHDNVDESVDAVESSAHHNPAEEQRVTADTYGALDTTSATDECWLIRIPPKLAELWERLPEGTDLGEFVFTKGGTLPNGTAVKPNISIHLNEDYEVDTEEPVDDDDRNPNGRNMSTTAATTASTRNLPLHYSLAAMTNKIPVMHPFMRNPKNGSVQLLGTVTRTANLQVEMQKDSAYRNLLKDRLVTANLQSARYVKPVEATTSVITQHVQKQKQYGNNSNNASTTTSSKKKHSFGDAVYQFGKKMLEAAEQAHAGAVASALYGGGPKSKKQRLFAPDQPLRSVIFELFGQQPYWTIKDLKAAAVTGGCQAANAKRAEAEIRDLLRNEIGEYHRSGDNKNKWELRKEFQQQLRQQQQQQAQQITQQQQQQQPPPPTLQPYSSSSSSQQPGVAKEPSLSENEDDDPDSQPSSAVATK